MGTPIRLRTDASWGDLDTLRWLTEGHAAPWLTDEERSRILALEPAKPGDCWPVYWHGSRALAGYAICCPLCVKIHCWSSASNCENCTHQGTGSCWEWTGDAAAGTLSAHPSLFASGECGWHGWLRNGELVV